MPRERVIRFEIDSRAALLFFIALLLKSSQAETTTSGTLGQNPCTDPLQSQITAGVVYVSSGFMEKFLNPNIKPNQRAEVFFKNIGGITEVGSQYPDGTIIDVSPYTEAGYEQSATQNKQAIEKIKVVWLDASRAGVTHFCNYKPDKPLARTKEFRSWTRRQPLNS